MITDFDDVGALAFLHALADAGECEILATISSTRGTFRMVGDNGNNEWAPDEENGPHLRVTERMPKAEVGRIIDELMTRAPKHTSK